MFCCILITYAFFCPTEIPLLDSLAEIKTKEHEGVRTYTHVTSAAGGLIEVRKTGLKSERRKK